MATTTHVDRAVREILERFAQAYSAKDVDGALALFAPGDEVQLVGTGADEIRLGGDELRQQVERDFAQADRLSLSYGDLHIDGVGDIAWVLVPCTVDASVGRESVVMNVRLTAVLERRDDSWLIRQTHLSAPFADQAPGESFPTA